MYPTPPMPLSTECGTNQWPVPQAQLAKRSYPHMTEDEIEAKSGYEMTTEDCREYGLKQRILGDFDGIPVRKGSLCGTIRHASPETINLSKFKLGCKQALDEYNSGKEIQLEFVDVVRANNSGHIYYPTFGAKDQNNFLMIFQAELSLTDGKGLTLMEDKVPQACPPQSPQVLAAVAMLLKKMSINGGGGASTNYQCTIPPYELPSLEGLPPSMPRGLYCHYAVLLEEVKSLSKSDLDKLPFTEMVMLVTMEHPPPGLYTLFRPPPEFRYFLHPPREGLPKDDICLSFEQEDMKRGRRPMTYDEQEEYYRELARIGKYEELPVPEAWDTCIIFRLSEEDVEKLNISSGCEEALLIYNNIRKTELKLVEITKVNCRSIRRCRMLYVTMCVRDPNDDGKYIIFQTELVRFVGSKAYIVWEILRSKKTTPT